MCSWELEYEYYLDKCANPDPALESEDVEEFEIEGDVNKQMEEMTEEDWNALQDAVDYTDNLEQPEKI